MTLLGVTILGIGTPLAILGSFLTAIYFKTRNN